MVRFRKAIFLRKHCWIANSTSMVRTSRVVPFNSEDVDIRCSISLLTVWAAISLSTKSRCSCATFSFTKSCTLFPSNPASACIRVKVSVDLIIRVSLKILFFCYPHSPLAIHCRSLDIKTSFCIFDSVGGSLKRP